MRHRRAVRIRKRPLVWALVGVAVAVVAGATAWVTTAGVAETPSDPVVVAGQALDLAAKIYDVEVRLEHGCMEGRGFTVHPDDVDRADYVLVPTMDEASRYGFENGAEENATSGFTARPLSYQRDYLIALAGSADWNRTSGVPPESGTCLAEVNQQLYATVDGPRRPVAFDAATQATFYDDDPGLVAAYDSWRACMRSKGDYPDFATVEQARRYGQSFYEKEDYADAHPKELALAVDVSTCASGSGLREAFTKARDTARSQLYQQFLPDIIIWRDTLTAALVRTGASPK